VLVRQLELNDHIAVLWPYATCHLLERIVGYRDHVGARGGQPRRRALVACSETLR
jgi:hypothetical protein